MQTDNRPPLFTNLKKEPEIWRIDRRSNSLKILDAKYNIVASIYKEGTTAEANAQLIVEAVNNYSKLVEENRHLTEENAAQTSMLMEAEGEKELLVEENERLRDALGDASTLLRHLSEHLTDSGREQLKRFYSLL